MSILTTVLEVGIGIIPFGEEEVETLRGQPKLPGCLVPEPMP